METAERSAPPERGRVGCLFLVLSGILLLFLSLAIGYQLWHANAVQALQVQLDAIRERGEPLRFSDLAPQGIDSEQDGSPLYLAALSRIRPLGDPFLALIQADPPAPPGVYPEIEEALAANEGALEQLAEALRKPHFRLPIDYQTLEPLAIQLQPVQQLREFARLLQGKVLHSVATGDRRGAVMGVEHGLLLSESLREEPFFISQLVRIAVAGTSVHSLQVVLGYSSATPDELSSLDGLLSRIQNEFELAPAAVGERAALLTTMTNLAQQNASNNDLTGELQLFRAPFLRPYLLMDQAFALEIMSDYAAIIDVPGSEADRKEEAIDGRIRQSEMRHIISRMLLPAVIPMRRAGLQYRQRLTNVRLGLRVHRYRVENGGLPDSLDEVLDEKISALPPDLLSRHSLVYRVFGDGFVIYSVGDNGVDDWGKPTRDRAEQANEFRVTYPASD